VVGFGGGGEEGPKKTSSVASVTGLSTGKTASAGMLVRGPAGEPSALGGVNGDRAPNAASASARDDRADDAEAAEEVGEEAEEAEESEDSADVVDVEDAEDPASLLPESDDREAGRREESRARVRMEPGSEPPSGSVSPKQPTNSPVRSLGRKRSFWSSDPNA
jgi:hypothetical protein